MAGQHNRPIALKESLRHIFAHCIAEDDPLLANSNLLAILTHWLQSQEGAPIYGTNRHRETWARLLVGYRDMGEGALPESMPQPRKVKVGPVVIDYGVPYQPPTRPSFKFIDLYAGIGGFRIALQQLGGKCEFSCEWDRSAKETYYRNFGEIPFGDIREFTGEEVADTVIEKCIPDHDILAAGFPCQPFSRAGVSARQSLGQKHGFSCEIQGTLFFDIVRIARVKRPQVLLLENVKHLKGHEGGRTFETIRTTIEKDLGYSFSDEVIDASSLVPQRRERCFMVCFREKSQQFRFPLLMKSPLPLSSILESNPLPHYTISDRLWQGHQKRTQRNLARGAGFTAFEATLSKPANTLVARYGKDGKDQEKPYRDVFATFFPEELFNDLRQDPLNRETDGARPFCCTADDGRLMIHLKRDQASFARFCWNAPDGMLRIHFFYNRPFGRSPVNSRGTYTKGFRPDYTLVIMPGDILDEDWLDAERWAEEQGRIAYLHFDAKYRVERLTGILGESDEEGEEDRRTAKATGTFKNADLYKMHTYNEAIRRTVGSYVLYPGDDPGNEVNRNRFERYHEIIPGVGAFAMRPPRSGGEAGPVGLSCLVDFVEDILHHQLSKFTQSRNISHWTEETIRHSPVTVRHGSENIETVPLPAADVVMGYMRKAAIDAFRNGRFFYCRATDRNGDPLTLDLSAAQGAFLVGWWGPRTGPFLTVDWIGRISSCRLVDKAGLTNEIGVKPSGSSLHYLRFRLADITTSQPRDVSALVAAKKQRWSRR